MQDAFREATRKLDPGLKETFLLHGAADATLWRIVTVWPSRQALDQLRRSNETPRGVPIFRAAGVEPALSVFDVAGSASV